jgi:hypothetical protein
MVKHGKAEKSAARSERLSAALRENLKRRKAQARSRAGDGQDDHAASPAGDGENESVAPDFRRNRGRNSQEGSGGAGR